tara:strand:- start:5212 stop:6093 length:882 start_codon:yes stop_codon:yes gene_type:complete
MSNLAKYLMAAAGNTSSAEEGVDYREASEYTHIAFDTVVDSGATVGDLRGVFIKPDGTKFYHIDVGENLEEYNLSTPFDITSHSNRVSTANIRTSSYSNGLNAAATGIFFKPDGTKMWCSDVDDHLYEYTLSTAWDISTISYTRYQSFTAEFDTFRGVYFSPDGTKMFGIDNTLDRVKRFSLSTAWDMTTETYHSQSSLLDVSTTINEATPIAFWMSDDGLIAYVVGTTRDYIYSWNLTTAWDITQINSDADSSLYIGTQEGAARDMCFSPNGRYLYICGANGHGVDVWDRGT